MTSGHSVDRAYLMQSRLLTTMRPHLVAVWAMPIEARNEKRESPDGNSKLDLLHTYSIQRHNHTLYHPFGLKKLVNLFILDVLTFFNASTPLLLDPFRFVPTTTLSPLPGKFVGGIEAAIAAADMFAR